MENLLYISIQNMNRAVSWCQLSLSAVQAKTRSPHRKQLPVPQKNPLHSKPKKPAIPPTVNKTY